MIGQAGIGDRFNRVVCGEEVRYRQRIVAMSFHPQWQGIESLEEIKRVGRTQRGAEIAQALDP